MSDQYFRNGFNRADHDEGADEETNRPLEIADQHPESVPADAVLLIPETAQHETLAAVPVLDDMAVQMAPQSEPIPYATSTGAKVETPAALLDGEVSEHFRTRWNAIQGKFVDEPRTAVQEADGLVSEVVAQITQVFSNERSSLESQWKQGADISTEDLRKALQHYRSFFNRLVL